MMKKRHVIAWSCGLLAALMNSAALRAQDAAGWQVQAGDEWRAVDQSDMRVVPGSALDFSALVEKGPAGAHGRVIVSPQGVLAFAEQPDRPARFLCCSEGMATFRYSSPEEIEAYADEVVRAGYNMFRPHFLDAFLMRNTQVDLEFSPKSLEIWDRLSAALKQRGVYLYLDATTTGAFYSHIGPWSPGIEKVPERTVTMYWDPEAREHWRAGVTKLLSHVNPYTGMALKDDPQVAILQFRNESGLGFKTFFFRSKENNSNRVVTANFRLWLTRKYGTSEKLQKAWSNQNISLDSVKLPELYAGGPDTLDLYRFFTESERALFTWERETVRSLGVKSVVLDFNNMHNVYSHVVRDMMDVTDGHAYHAHPTMFDAPGSKIALHSVAETSAVEFIPMASARQWGRPFVCSEWGQPFWHPWRGAEAGLVVPAYAALQGWQMLTQHGSPIMLSARREVQPFSIAADPANKAAERMAALLYLRGDVRRSPHIIQANIDAQAVNEGKLSPAFGLPETLTRLGLLAGFGTRVTGMPDSAPRAAYKADVEFTPSAGGKLITQAGVQYVELDESAEKRTLLEQEIQSLRRAGVLSAANRTNAAKGLYESDTGEILLNSAAKQMQISTPRSQGFSLHPGAPEMALPNLRAKTNSGTMGVFAGSLDGQPLAESSRMLLIVATDALNSGMEFTDAARGTLVRGGKLPVLVKTAKLDITVANTNAAQLELWALDLRGRRLAEIPLKKDVTGAVSAAIDTAGIAGEPSIYFELVVKQ